MTEGERKDTSLLKPTRKTPNNPTCYPTWKKVLPAFPENGVRSYRITCVLALPPTGYCRKCFTVSAHFLKDISCSVNFSTRALKYFRKSETSINYTFKRLEK